MLNVILLSVAALSVVMLNDIMLSVIMLSIVMLNVMAPFNVDHVARLLSSAMDKLELACQNPGQVRRYHFNVMHLPSSS